SNRIDSSGLTDTQAERHNPDPGHCHLSYTLSLLRWTTSSRIPTSDWHFVTSFQEGPEGGIEPFGIPAAAISCVWERTYASEVWSHTLNFYWWVCRDACMWPFPGRAKGNMDQGTVGEETQFVSQTSGGTERTTTQHLSLGAEDETNDLLCQIDPRSR